MTREILLPWFTTAAVTLLLFVNILQPSLLAISLAATLAAIGFVLFPQYRRRGTVAMLIGAAAASLIAMAIRSASS